MEERQFSFFNGPITNVVPTATCTVKQVYKFITANSKLEEMTAQLRAIPKEDEKARRAAKARLPSITPHGVFRRRNDKSMIVPSGELVIDLDKVANLEMACQLRDELFDDANLAPDLAFGSPNWGVKLLIPFDVSPYEPLVQTLSLAYNTYWDYIERNYGGRYQMVVDRCGDLSRACFLCHDSGAKVRM